MEDEKQPCNCWEDEEFVAELDRRAEGLESGKVKGVTWEESIEQASQSLKKQKKPGA